MKVLNWSLILKMGAASIVGFILGVVATILFIIANIHISLP